jgi:hypothetical protein
MPVFFFFNHDVANLFAPGNNGQQALRNRDLGFLFPTLLFMGTLSGAPQLVLPLGLYMLLGPQANGALNGGNQGSFYAKLAAFFAIACIMFWDFFPSFGLAETEPELPPPRRRPLHRPVHQGYEERVFVPEDTVVVSAFSEISLVLLISMTLAVISHWEEVHSYIARSLPRSAARRFRQLTRALNIHPNNATQALRPASAEAIRALEEVEITAVNQGDCSICLENFKIGERAKRLPCKHMFHTQCLSPWLAQRSSCPVCRACVERDEQEEQASPDQNQSQPATSNRESSFTGINAVWNALRSVVDPSAVINQNLQVEDRHALMQLSIRELRERALARSISLRNVVEKSEIVDLLLGNARTRS